jgi:rare lipoprotein A
VPQATPIKAIKAASASRASSFLRSADKISDVIRINVVAALIIAYVAVVCAGAVAFANQARAFANQARALASAASQGPESFRQTISAPQRHLDRSGQNRIGKASFYAQKFAGRTMADGARMNPDGANAASRTLPLGTTAKVTNLETGQSAIVTIQDRGPYADNLIVDLSPSTARKIGISKAIGVAKVEVAPIMVPQLDGSVKAGVVARREHG